MNALAAGIQVLIALAFVSIPVIRARWGAAAQSAAEAELTRQGLPTTVLAENKLRFDAGGHETAAPASIAAVLVALAALNLFGSPLGETLTWILQPLVILINGAILYSQLTAVRAVEAPSPRRTTRCCSGWTSRRSSPPPRRRSRRGCSRARRTSGTPSRSRVPPRSWSC